MVRLGVEESFVQLTINDRGVGFDLNDRPAKKSGTVASVCSACATYAGGALVVNSAPRPGTEIVVRGPISAAVTATTGPPPPARD